MQLTFDAEVEAFRAKFIAFLDEHLPDEAGAGERPRSSSDIPDWARRWHIQGVRSSALLETAASRC